MENMNPSEFISSILPVSARFWLRSTIGDDFTVISQESGSYNWNLIIAVPNQRSIVLRIPKKEVRLLDLRNSNEGDVLRSLSQVASLSSYTPKLVSKGPSGLMLIEHVGTHTLDLLSPKKVAVEQYEIAQLANILVALHTRSDWSSSALGQFADSGILPRQSGKYTCQRSHFSGVWMNTWKSYSQQLKHLGLPEPQRFLDLTAHDPYVRPATAIHGDIHRKNLRTDRTKQELFLIDWETAFIADPVYDVAVALHKLQLPAYQSDVLTESWQKSLPNAATKGWSKDLAAYTAFITARTACLQFLRSLDSWHQPTTDHSDQMSIALKYSSQVNAAAHILGYNEVDVELITSILNETLKVDA